MTGCGSDHLRGGAYPVINDTPGLWLLARWVAVQTLDPDAGDCRMPTPRHLWP